VVSPTGSRASRPTARKEQCTVDRRCLKKPRPHAENENRESITWWISACCAPRKRADLRQGPDGPTAEERLCTPAEVRCVPAMQTALVSCEANSRVDSAWPINLGARCRETCPPGSEGGKMPRGIYLSHEKRHATPRRARPTAPPSQQKAGTRHV
jgi:hypothetical protein